MTALPTSAEASIFARWRDTRSPIDDGGDYFRRRELELAELRWGGSRQRGPRDRVSSVYAPRGRLSAQGRYRIPAWHFLEFTGAKPPKSSWKITKVGRTGVASRAVTTDAGQRGERVHAPHRRALPRCARLADGHLDRADW